MFIRASMPVQSVELPGVISNFSRSHRFHGISAIYRFQIAVITFFIFLTNPVSSHAIGKSAHDLESRHVGQKKNVEMTTFLISRPEIHSVSLGQPCLILKPVRPVM